jgi:hypothetical protein
VSRRAAPGAGERPGEHPGVGCGYQLCGSSAVTAAVRRAPGRARNARAVGGHRLVCIVRDRRWHGCLPPRGGPVCAVGRREPGAGQVAGVLVCPAVRRPGRRCGQASAAAAWSGRASACAAGVRLAGAGVHCPRPAGGACTASGSRRPGGRLSAAAARCAVRGGSREAPLTWPAGSANHQTRQKRAGCAG